MRQTAPRCRLSNGNNVIVPFRGIRWSDGPRPVPHLESNKRWLNRYSRANIIDRFSSRESIVNNVLFLFLFLQAAQSIKFIFRERGKLAFFPLIE